MAWTCIHLINYMTCIRHTDIIPIEKGSKFLCFSYASKYRRKTAPFLKSSAILQSALKIFIFLKMLGDHMRQSHRMLPFWFQHIMHWFNHRLRKIAFRVHMRVCIVFRIRPMYLLLCACTHVLLNVKNKKDWASIQLNCHNFTIFT